MNSGPRWSTIFANSRPTSFIAPATGARERRFMARLRTWCRKLGDTPLIGTAHDELGPGLRVVGFERRASIVFRVEADRVVIVNVLYGGRDLDAFYRALPNLKL